MFETRSRFWLVHHDHQGDRGKFGKDHGIPCAATVACSPWGETFPLRKDRALITSPPAEHRLPNRDFCRDPPRLDRYQRCRYRAGFAGSWLCAGSTSGHVFTVAVTQNVRVIGSS